jgi:membrane-bound metal-dependent hydrolase YbcI (DUF457 family)
MLAIPGEGKSYAVGHIAFAYLSSKASARVLRTRLNIPLALTLSVIPDADLLFPFLEHRGPTHSVITALIVFAPLFFVFRKKALPYFVALVQHSLVGDFIAGGRIQLLWPITTQLFGMTIDIRSTTNVAIEWGMFLASIAVMFVTRDVATFFRCDKSNLILMIPTFTVLLPTILSFPMNVPVWLVPPHVVYSVIFLVAIVLALFGILKPGRRKG